MENKNVKRISVLSGGGTRGSIQLPLFEIAEKIHGRPFNKIYDLVVGTSVGSINGGLMSTGNFSATEYKKIFLDLVKEIFYLPWWKSYKRIPPFAPIYDRKVFFDSMITLVGNNYSMKLLKTKFICTSVNICDIPSPMTHYFKSWEVGDGELQLATAIARSFAAAYYFGQIVDEEDKIVWADGGEGTDNCPLDDAWMEAQLQGWDCDKNIDKIIIDVFGTGYTNSSIPFPKAKKQGTIEQAKNYISPATGGLAAWESTANKYREYKNLAKKRKNLTVNIYDCEIPEDKNKMDDLSNLDYYLECGNKLAMQYRLNNC